MRTLNIGLTEEQRHGVIELLNRDVADLYLLLIKTKKYHWDVIGPQFRTLHTLWEEHYNALNRKYRCHRRKSSYSRWLSHRNSSRIYSIRLSQRAS